MGDKCLNLSLGLNHAKKSMRVMATRELVNSLKEEEVGGIYSCNMKNCSCLLLTSCAIF